MRRVRVDSSALRSIGYQRDIAVLEIEFVSGEIYQDPAVPPAVHRELMDAESRGRYFVEHVRDVYPTAHVT